MSFNKINKGNPKWVRQGQGNKTGDFHWEYRVNGKYYAEGYYKTAEEAYKACLKHKLWIGPEKYRIEEIKNAILYAAIHGKKECDIDCLMDITHQDDIENGMRHGYQRTLFWMADYFDLGEFFEDKIRPLLDSLTRTKR